MIDLLYPSEEHRRHTMTGHSFVDELDLYGIFGIGKSKINITEHITVSRVVIEYRHAILDDFIGGDSLRRFCMADTELFQPVVAQ